MREAHGHADTVGQVEPEERPDGAQVDQAHDGVGHDPGQQGRVFFLQRLPDGLRITGAGKGMHGNRHTQVDEHIIERAGIVELEKGQGRRQSDNSSQERIDKEGADGDEQRVPLVGLRLVQHVARGVLYLEIHYFKYGHLQQAAE